MKKKMNKIILIVLILLLFTMNFYITNAAEASLSATNCTEGEKIAITITMPSDAVGYSGTSITITYSDGTTNSIGRFSKLNYDFNTNTYSSVGNYSTSFDAKVAGNAIIKVEGLVLTNSTQAQINSNTSLSTTVNIAAKPAPAPNPEPSTPSNGNEGTGNTGNTGNTDNGTSTPKPETPKTPKVLTFTDVNEKVYTTKRVNLRQNYGTTGGLIKTLAVGEELTRTGKSTSADESGYYWSRVTYNGTTGYVITSSLTTEKPVEKPKEEPEEETKNEVENTVVNEVVNNTVNEIDGNELTKITEEIGVIPEVGNNIMVNFLFASIIVSIIMIVIVKKNKYEE